MMLNIDKIGDDTLLSYVDNQLDIEDSAIVETYLQAHPDKAALVETWRAQTRAIKTLHDQTAEEPIPDRLNPLQMMRPPSAANTNFWRNIAAAIVLLSVGTSAGWLSKDYLEPNPSVSQTLVVSALDAHQVFAPQTRHAVEVGGDESEHLMSWLSKSLDRSFALPTALPNGFQLAGGRLLSAQGAPAAQFIYDAGEKRISLYVTPRNPEQPSEPVFQTGEKVAALYWANSAITCTIVGDLPRAELEEIARKVYQALDWNNENGWRS